MSVILLSGKRVNSTLLAVFQFPRFRKMTSSCFCYPVEKRERERKRVSSVFSLSDEFNPRFLILAPKSRFYKNVPSKSSREKNEGTEPYVITEDNKSFYFVEKKDSQKDFSFFCPF